MKRLILISLLVLALAAIPLAQAPKKGLSGLSTGGSIQLGADTQVCVTVKNCSDQPRFLRIEFSDVLPEGNTLNCPIEPQGTMAPNQEGQVCVPYQEVSHPGTHKIHAKLFVGDETEKPEIELVADLKVGPVA